jgi:hypothetical protein
VIVPIFTPPVRIDADHVEQFAQDVGEFVNRYDAMVIDCSQVSWITTSAMRFLAAASREAQITLVHPSPAVHLMAATHGVDVRLRAGRRSFTDSDTASPPPRVASLHRNGKAASGR